MWSAVVLFLLTIVLSIFFLINHFTHNTKEGKLFDQIPGPRTLPVIGNIFDLSLGPVTLFYQLRNLSSRFPFHCSLWMFHHRILNVYNAEDIQVILTSQKHIKKSIYYSFLHPWLKKGLITSTGLKWRSRRKIITPAFNLNILRQFCHVFDEQSLQLVEALKLKLGNKKGIDVHSYTTQFALHSICETAMGTKLNENNSSANSYKNAVHDMGELLVYRLLRPWLYLPNIFNISSNGKHQKKTLSLLHDFTDDVIRKRRISKMIEEPKEKSNAMSGETDNANNQKTSVMLDVLLLSESTGEINEHGVREEVDTFMFGGHDTTAMAIACCLMELANNNEAQERASNELEEIFGDSTSRATMGELMQMHYLERCIKETLRLYPSVPFIARHLSEQVQLSKYLIPENTIFFINIFELHRCPNIYPTPDIFDPDRFLPENCSSRHPFSFIPFSAGPRNCIGQKYAILEIKSAISRILRNFLLEPVTMPEDIIFTANIVLRSKDPIYVKFTPRKII